MNTVQRTIKMREYTGYRNRNGIVRKILKIEDCPQKTCCVSFTKRASCLGFLIQLEHHENLGTWTCGIPTNRFVK